MLEKAGADVTALQVIRSLDQQRSVMMDVEQYKMQNGKDGPPIECSQDILM